MDPLGDIIALLRPRAVLSKPISASGRWGVRYKPTDLASYALVLEGGCWLTLEGQTPLRLEAGDFLLFPTMPAFEMASDLEADSIPGAPSGQPIHYGDASLPRNLWLLGGGFRIELANATLFRTILPSPILLKAGDIDTRGLSQIIQLIVDENAGERPGADMVLQRLLEVLLVQVLRSAPPVEERMPAGTLAGLGDPAVAKTLSAIHADVRGPWTVSRLASIAGMSRSTFAARFKAVVGCGPIDYLGRWRIAIAKDALSRGGTSLEKLAERIGFESASAFSTAFRRQVGCSPGGFGRSSPHADSVAAV